MRRPSLSPRFLYGLFVILLSGALFLVSSGTAGAGNKPPDKPLLRISVMDIGQGDSILIQSPSGRAALIDAGPGAGQALLINQLTHAGLKQIDLAIESHPHEDHIGGFPAVIDAFTVRNFTDPGTTHTTATYQTLLSRLKEKKIPYRVATRGQKYKLDEGLMLEILAPRKTLISGSSSDLNNNSTSVRLTYGDFSMIFIGDSEGEAESRLVADGVPQTTILKVGHHGSHSSSTATFVDKIKPQAAVLSCETGNDYGHPHKKTLDTFSRRGITLYRTDMDGEVRFLTDGHQYWVETFSRASITANKGTGDPEPTRIEGPVAVRASGGSALEPGNAAVASDAGRTDAPSEPSNATQTPANERNASSSGSDHGSKSSSHGAQEGSQASSGSSEAIPDGAYVASSKSKVFHKSNCSAARKISEQNRVIYKNREEAVASGKEPAKDCKP